MYKRFITTMIHCHIVSLFLRKAHWSRELNLPPQAPNWIQHSSRDSHVNTEHHSAVRTMNPDVIASCRTHEL